MPTDPPENTTLSNGSVNVELGAQPPRVSCSSKAYPEPSYEWRRYGRVIAKGNVLYIFRNMTVDDAGAYECVAFNKHGNSSAAVHVNVLCRCFLCFLRAHARSEHTMFVSDLKLNFVCLCVVCVLFCNVSARQCVDGVCSLCLFLSLSLSLDTTTVRPNCTIVRKEINADDTLACIAVGNPPEVGDFIRCTLTPTYISIRTDIE